MKKTAQLFLPLLLALALLAGCGGGAAGTADTPGPVNTPAPVDTPEPEGAVMTARLVEDGLLAEGEDGPYGGTAVLTFGVGEDTAVTVDGQPARAEDLKPGMLLTITWNGMVAESYPGQLGPVYAVSADSGETDDRCGLYLRVLEDLWETDPALNTDLEELALDLSGLTDLTESEKAALVWQFGNAHGLMPVTATWEELVEEGRIDGENLTWNGKGCLFTLTGSAEEGFSAEKWASGLGAYVFADCTAQRAADGTWSYEVGSHAIA